MGFGLLWAAALSTKKTQERQRPFVCWSEAAQEQNTDTQGSVSDLDNALVGAENEQLESSTLEDNYPKLWLHDVAQCIESPTSKALELAHGSIPDLQIETSVRKAVRQAFMFLFYGELTANGKALNTWSSARNHITSDIVKAHLRTLRTRGSTWQACARKRMH